MRTLSAAATALLLTWGIGAFASTYENPPAEPTADTPSRVVNLAGIPANQPDPTPPSTEKPLERRLRPSRASRRVSGPCDRECVLERIARCESGGRYDAENRRSTASGKYQALDSTWDGYGGYQRAKDAPPEVQEEWARQAYDQAGTRPWNASRRCWG